MRILGIDPGTAMLGYGLVERTGSRLRSIDYGVISTPSDMALPQRLESIYLTLTDLIELHNPALIGVERLFFTKNVQTAFAVGQARGVVLLAAALHDIEIREATPNEVKSATAGHGACTGAAVHRANSVMVLLTGSASRYSCRTTGPLTAAAIRSGSARVNDGDAVGLVDWQLRSAATAAAKLSSTN